MAYGILKFNLDKAEDKEAFERAQKAEDAFAVISEYDSFLRSRLKYEEHTQQVSDTLQSARDRLHELIQDNGIEL